MGIWKFEEYQTAKNKKALGIQLHIRDMASQSEQPFPAHLRTEVSKYAPRLADAFNDLGEILRLRRHLVSGQRLDPRKKRDIGKAMQRGLVDENELRPYIRRESSPSLPSICVVASAGVDEVNADRTYIGRVTELSIAVAWACEIVGVSVTAALMESVLSLHPSQPYREAILGYTLIQPGRVTPLQAYNVALNRSSFYGVGFRNAYLSDTNAQQRAAALHCKTTLAWGAAYLSKNGGNATHWARTLHHADIVIAIGNITDAAEADIRLETGFKVQDAIQSIADQARRITPI